MVLTAPSMLRGHWQLSCSRDLISSGVVDDRIQSLSLTFDIANSESHHSVSDNFC